ncbi:MAG: NTP transferase domain-containing protein [Alphaproteobacteria bacterium]|nr:NTP transferase domain-containing protein [Alphaproteobacteria bacterium]
MIGLVIQARYGSSRLRGKILLPMAGQTALDYVAQNALKVAGIDVVCFAIADDSASDIIAEHLHKNYPEILVMRGDQHDVLARYYHAAKQLRLDDVMRITSDCPLFDPALASKMVAHYQRENADYISNNYLPSFPHGVDAEIMRFDALQQAYQQATLPTDREHVTPYIRAKNDCRKLCIYDGQADEWQLAQRWTLDYAEDYQFLDRLIALLHQQGHDADADYRTISNILREQPELYQLNQMRHVKRELVSAPLSARDDDGWRYLDVSI